MKNTKLLLAIATSAALLTGCQNTHGIDTNMAISSGLNAYKAATLSDADAKAIANQGCAEMDSGNQVASKSSKYGKRLAKIAKALGNNIKEGANKQVISSQADSLIKISRIWADFFPANTSNQPI
ncbi:hypothetical protein VEE69_27250 [Escherichia coli]|nr:hypothetical protein VEE69_27250 [Escherichia coli]